MLKLRVGMAVLGSVLLAAPVLRAVDWPAPKAPAVPGTDGYISIPKAAVPPEKAHIYKAIYNASQAADRPSNVVPALNMAGSELNALAVENVPLDNAKFVVVFHGDAIDAILDNAHYKAKHGVDNPNLKVMSDLKKAGVSLFVCGQNMAAINMDPATISPDVTVASDALIVLMTYENQGYALLDF